MKKVLMILAGLSVCAFITYAISYHVGPSQSYANISDVPLELLSAGDTVYIHYQEVPYREKFVIHGAGTSLHPIVFCGVPSQTGALPVISGDKATVVSKRISCDQSRGIIHIGGADNPPDITCWIVVENLCIQSARPGYYYYDASGPQAEYADNAAGIYIERGDHITIRGCVLRDCANGLFTSTESKNILMEYCTIYDNGMDGSAYQHNSYTLSDSIVIQFNKFGRLRPDCPGNNIKDRSTGTIIRYNWIEGGNRLLDLVESEFYDFTVQKKYRSTYVYNNVLIESENEGSRTICHYGGDGGYESFYRKGVLHFYNNTIVSYRSGRTTLFRLSTAEETADVRNNVFYTDAADASPVISNLVGTVNLRNNWLKEGWQSGNEPGEGMVNDISGNLTGTDPGFIDVSGMDFSLHNNSELIGNAGEMNDSLPVDLYPLFKFISDTPNFAARNDFMDIGAYSRPAFEISAGVNPPSSGTVDGTGIYDLNATVELMASPAANFDFVNWTEDGNEVSVSADYSFTVTGNRNLTANFVLQSHMDKIQQEEHAAFLYFNPVNHMLTIIMRAGENTGELTVIDLSGQVVMQRKINQPKTDIDLDHLSSGVYVVRCSDAGPGMVAKIVK
jgi:hypothetical protein